MTEDQEKKAIAEVMKMLYKESAIRKELLDALVLFSEQERKKHSDWRKGQALCSCASIAFPHIVNSKILKSDATILRNKNLVSESFGSITACRFLFMRFLWMKALATTRRLPEPKTTRNIGKSLARARTS